MSLRTSLVWHALLYTATAAANWSYYLGLPDKVPLHWNASGQVDRSGGKAELITMYWAFLGLMIFTVLLTEVTMKAEPDKRAALPKARIWIVGQSALMCAMYTVILRISGGTWTLASMWLLVHLAIAATGLGIRNAPASMINMPGADDQTKVESASRMGLVMAIGGGIGVWFALGNAPDLLHFWWLMAVCLYPLVEVVRVMVQSRQARGI